MTLGENPVFAKETFNSTSVLNGASATSGTFVTGINAKTGKPVTGKAAGRALYSASVAGNVYYCDGVGEANLLRFKDVRPGDTVRFFQ